MLGSPPVFPVAIRLSLDLRDAAAVRAADAVISGYEAHHLKLWLATSLPPNEREAEAWRLALHAWLTSHRKSLVILELRLTPDAVAAAAFAIRAASTDLRVSVPGAELAIGVEDAVRDRLPALVTRDLAAYIDLLSMPRASDASAVLAAVATEAPGLNIIASGDDLPADAPAAAGAYASAVIDALGTRVTAVCARGSSDAVKAALRALRPAATLLTGDVDAVDAAASSLRLGDTEPAASADVSSRLLFENHSFGTYLFLSAPASTTPLEIRVNVPVEGTPMIVDLTSGAVQRATGYVREGTTVRVQAPRTGHPTLIDFNADASGEVMASRTDVTATRQLTVEEIIARHQQQQPAQDAAVEHYVATRRMEQHFRPTLDRSRLRRRDREPLFRPRRRRRVGGAVVLGQRLEVGARIARRFRCCSRRKCCRCRCSCASTTTIATGWPAPSASTVSTATSSRSIPSISRRALYRGTVWIDRRTFARVRVQAVQTRPLGAGRLERRDQRYSPVIGVGDRPVFLLTRPDGAPDRADCRPQPAGREVRVAFRDFQVNGAGFVGSARSARAGATASCIARPTSGLRYFVKDGGTRVVSDRPTNQAKAMAMGVTIDPSYAFPLPIFGINYLNFALRIAEHAARDAVRRRAGGGQHPAPEDCAHAFRRERRFLRHRGAVERRVYDSAGEHRERAAC